MIKQFNTRQYTCNTRNMVRCHEAQQDGRKCSCNIQRTARDVWKKLQLIQNGSKWFAFVSLFVSLWPVLSRHLLGVALHAGNFLNGGTPFGAKRSAPLSAIEHHCPPSQRDPTFGGWIIEVGFDLIVPSEALYKLWIPDRS